MYIDGNDARNDFAFDAAEFQMRKAEPMMVNSIPVIHTNKQTNENNEGEHSTSSISIHQRHVFVQRGDNYIRIKCESPD